MVLPPETWASRLLVKRRVQAPSLSHGQRPNNPFFLLQTNLSRKQQQTKDRPHQISGLNGRSQEPREIMDLQHTRDPDRRLLETVTVVRGGTGHDVVSG